MFIAPQIKADTQAWIERTRMILSLGSNEYITSLLLGKACLQQMNLKK